MKILCVGLVLCLFFTAAGALRAADPVAVEIHYQSGVKYFKRGLYDKAIQEFEKTLEMEPQHDEARAYLIKVRELQKVYRPAQARASKDAEIRKLYDEGRRLYRAREYKEAIGVFNKILSLKPIDDFASYYRERSEILLSRKIAREKKLEERKRRLEEKKEARAAARRKKKKVPPAAKKETASAVTAALDDVESPAVARERKHQEKLQLKEERRQEKLRTKEEKRAEAKRRRETKLRTKEEKRQEKLARKESHLKAKEEKVAVARTQREQEEARSLDKRETRKKLREERRRIKERFLEGVKAYGRKEYKTAIAALKDIIKAEEKTGALYTRSANRLIDKSRKRLEGIGKDITI